MTFLPSWPDCTLVDGASQHAHVTMRQPTTLAPRPLTRTPLIMGNVKLSDRIDRFVVVGGLAAGVYAGYKAISVREQCLGLDHEAAEAKRHAHHSWSARGLYDIAV